MRTLFTRFRISDSEEKDSELVMGKIIQLCNEWVQNIYPDFIADREGKQSFAGNYIDIENNRFEGFRFWKMKRSEEGNNHLAMRFENFIFIAKENDTIEFSLLQSIILPIDRIAPYNIPIYPPWIINKLIDTFQCEVDNKRISSNWNTISPSKIGYLSRKISDPKRRLPIIVMSKSWEDKKSIIRKPGKLSRKLAGLAEIYILSDPNTKQLGDVFGQQWVSNGSLRIFWPGRGSKELLKYNPSWENMYNKKRLEKDFDNDIDVLSQDIINRICLATMSQQASSDFVKNVRKTIGESVLDIQRDNDKKERELILAEKKNSADKIKYLEDELIIQNQKYSMLEIEYKKSEFLLEENKDTIESLQHRITVLDDENSSYKAIIHAIEEVKRRKPDATKEDFMAHLESFGIEENIDGPEPEPEFKTIIDALNSAKVNFSRIKLLDSVFESAKKTSSDADPSEVYEFLRMLNDIIWQEIKNDIDKNKKNNQRIQIHGLMSDNFSGKYAESESNKTMNKYKKDFNYRGRFFQLNKNKKIRMKAHLKLGSNSNPLRIHFICLNDKSSYEVVEEIFDDEGKKIKISHKKEFSDFPKIIVGWCGDHLPT